MTEQQLRQKVVTIMTGWIGCKESDGSHKKILDVYNSHTPIPRGVKMLSSYSWCAATVSAAFIKAGLTDIAPVECSCSQMIALYKKIGRWEENDNYRPRPGDLIMYDWDDTGAGDCTGAPEHVGMVVSISGSTIKVIEGNKNDAVGYRTMQVGGKFIRGYCLPDYASKATAAVIQPAAPSNPSSAIKTDPVKSFNRTYAKTYTVTASSLNLRSGAGTNKAIIKSIPKGENVTCYGYYTQNGATIWLYVKDCAGSVGFCSKKYLK